MLALACSAFADSQTNSIAPGDLPVSARDFYNDGTELLASKKFSEAEQMFLSALAAQDEHVQPAALYNLAHARFGEGLAALKKGPNAQSITAQSSGPAAETASAIQQGEAALGGNDLSKLIAAYMAGHGARHDLRTAEAAVKEAIETYGETLRKWQRADDDFKSAAELNPADVDAARNAQIVEQYIARLVDSLRKMQDLGARLHDQHNKINQVLRQIGGRIPQPNLPPGAPGDKDEDDGMQPDPGSLEGMKEGATRTGSPIGTPLSPDQAAQILNGIPIDSAQQLMMNEAKTGRNQQPGLTW